jgi:hypothetical protein
MQPRRIKLSSFLVQSAPVPAIIMSCVPPNSLPDAASAPLPEKLVPSCQRKPEKLEHMNSESSARPASVLY